MIDGWAVAVVGEVGLAVEVLKVEVVRSWVVVVVVGFARQDYC